MRFLSQHGTKKGMRYTNECVKNEQHKNEGKEVMGGQHIEKMIQIANIIKTTLVNVYVIYCKSIIWPYLFNCFIQHRYHR